MAVSPLSLSDLVDISVTVAPAAATASSFNQGLFIGPSTVIPSYGANPRLRQYTSTTSMLSDGFTTSSPEYIAAQIYFSQNTAAQYMWIGRQDLTAIQTAVPNGRTVMDGVMSTTANAAYLVSVTAAFTSADVGKAITVTGAGSAGVDLNTTISSVISGFVAVLAVACTTSVTSATVAIGRAVANGAMSSTTNPTYLTSATIAFVAGDVGSTVIVAGAGTAGADLVTTVASVTSGTVAVLALPCLTTVSTAHVILGRSTTNGVMSTTTAATFLASATAAFVSGDIGSAIRVVGAGVAGADLVTTVASINGSAIAVLTAAATTSIASTQASLGAVGVGFKVNDVVTVVQSGASYGMLSVLTVGTSGQVLTLGPVISGQGTGYSVATGLTATGGSGSGLTVNITAVGETLLEAAEACRIANSTWYGLTVNAPTDADNLALAEWADPLWQTTRYYPYTASAAVLNGTAANLFLQLQALSLRVFPIYATTQNGLYPNNVYAAVAVMGVEMGLNTGLAGSFFSTAYKQLVGIAPEPLSQTQYANITGSTGSKFYGNVYADFGPFEFLQPSFMSNGAPSYLWLFTAMLVANMQYNILNAQAAANVIPQTNPGQQVLLSAVDTACATIASIGFIAGGVWSGSTVLSLSAGQAVPDGYLNQSQAYAKQSTANRAAGEAMPIYSAIITAGAVQSLLIGVTVQQ